MTDKPGTTAPGRGYADTVKKQHGLGDTSGRGTPDERRGFAGGREDNIQGSREDAALPLGKKPEEEETEEK